MCSPKTKRNPYTYGHGLDLFLTVLGEARRADAEEDLTHWFYNHYLGLASRGIAEVRDLVRQTIFAIEYAGQVKRAEWTQEDTVYRVSYDLDTDRYEILCFGMNTVDVPEGRYKGWDALPKWIQDRLSVLSVLKAPPPINDVPGVGRRMDEHLYWVYPD